MYPSGTGSSFRIRICIRAFFASDGDAGEEGEALGGLLIGGLLGNCGELERAAAIG
jgi:hypothetical protein